MPLEIHTCPDCGYSGHKGEFGNTEIGTKVRELINARLKPLVRDEKAFSGRRFEYAAWVAEWRERPSIFVGQLYHKAAWCCVHDEVRVEEERYYRRQAIECYERALQNGEIPGEQLTGYTYLIGEFYRRVGEQNNANLWFDRVTEIAGTTDDERRLANLAIQQKTEPKDFLD